MLFRCFQDRKKGEYNLPRSESDKTTKSKALLDLGTRGAAGATEGPREPVFFRAMLIKVVFKSKIIVKRAFYLIFSLYNDLTKLF